MLKFTATDLSEKFPTEESCLDFILHLLYPNGVYCQKCQKVTKHYRDAKRKSYSCEFCGKQVSPTAGTIMHKSSTPLRTWMHAIYLMSSSRCGISAKHLQRETGVTYKTAWRMFTQIRKLLNEPDTCLSGEVEVDETYIGGEHPGKRGRGAAGKTIVAGGVERHGKIVAKVVPDVKANTLLPLVKTFVLPPSVVYTDEMPSYNSLTRNGYEHKRIHHAAKVYVQGDVHTNTIDGFWSLVKRSIGGAHHAVSGKYLQLYLDEYTFRWNHREDDLPMFLQFLGQIATARHGG